MVSRTGGRLSPVLLAVPAALASAVLTGVARRFAVAHALLDVPNERSSHSVPTPRGGGLAIVAVTLLAVGLLWLGGQLAGDTAAALLGGGLVVAAVGWMDDRRGVHAPVRLAAHFVAAAWAVWWLGGLPTLVVGRHAVALGAGGAVLAAVAIVWAVNLTNFMDGIDGLAGTEAATVSLTAATLLAGGDPGVAAAAAATGGAAIGFLRWNWQPARIFMGDAGSGFIGFVLAVLGIASEHRGTLPVVLWILLYMVFAVDGTVTLLRRAAHGERWYAAHRSHAYQRLVQAGWSHARVTVAVLALNAALGALAWWAAADHARMGLAILVALIGCGLAYAAVERARPMSSSPAVPSVRNPLK